MHFYFLSVSPSLSNTNTKEIPQPHKMTHVIHTYESFQPHLIEHLTLQQVFLSPESPHILSLPHSGKGEGLELKIPGEGNGRCLEVIKARRVGSLD